MVVIDTNAVAYKFVLSMLVVDLLAIVAVYFHLRLALCRGGRTFHVLGEILTTYAVITDYCGQSPFISRKMSQLLCTYRKCAQKMYVIMRKATNALRAATFQFNGFVLKLFCSYTRHLLNTALINTTPGAPY